MAIVRKYHGRVPLKWWLTQPYAVWLKSVANVLPGPRGQASVLIDQAVIDALDEPDCSTLEAGPRFLDKGDAFSDQNVTAASFGMIATLATAWPIAPDKVVLSDGDRKCALFEPFVSPFQYELR